MNVLRSIEQKIEGLFEGMFGRAFRTNVQPVELARKLVKEMDDHRTVSVSRIYVPNEYTVYLSPADREQFPSYEGSLRNELQDYLAEHARREGYVLLTPPTSRSRPTTTSRSASSGSRRGWCRARSRAASRAPAAAARAGRDDDLQAAHAARRRTARRRTSRSRRRSSP